VPIRAKKVKMSRLLGKFSLFFFVFSRNFTNFAELNQKTIYRHSINNKTKIDL